jgi:hypothetical protein
MVNVYGAAAKVIKPSNADNTPNQTTNIVSPAEMAKAKTQMAKAAIGKSSANDPSILSKQKTSIHLPVSSPAGEI